MKEITIDGVEYTLTPKVTEEEFSKEYIKEVENEIREAEYENEKIKNINKNFADTIMKLRKVNKKQRKRIEKLKNKIIDLTEWRW